MTPVNSDNQDGKYPDKIHYKDFLKKAQYQTRAIPLEIMDGIQVNYEKCMGCGVCISKCAYGAMSLVAAEAKGIPLEISTLLEQAMASK